MPPQISPLRYASVEMTIHLGNEDERIHTELSSRPERSVVERSAVAFFRSSAAYPDDKTESGDSIGVGLRDAVIPITVEDDLLADQSL